MDSAVTERAKHGFPAAIRPVWALAILLFSFLAPTTRAVQADRNLSQLVHENFQIDQGLPQNAVYCLAQDRDGFLWLGTENGLVRFDGVTFEVFTEKSHGVPHNYTSSLLVGRDGTLWAAARTGGLWLYRNGKFEVPHPELARTHVFDLAESTDGYVWAATDEGLFRVDRELARFGREQGLPDDRLTALEPLPNGGLWIGTRGGDVGKFESGTYRQVLSKNDLTSGWAVKDLAHDWKTDELWIGRDGAGLWVLRSNVVSRVDLFPAAESEYLQVVRLDHEGALWLATADQGIVRYFERSLSYFNSAHGLADDDVLSILKDREGSVWVGTHYGGLFRFLDGKAATFSRHEGVPADIITSVIDGGPEILWLGTHGSGLVHYSHCQFTPVELGAATNAARADIRALLRGADGTVWIGTHGAGLGQYKTNGSVRFFTAKDGLAADQVTLLFQRRNGEIWVGTTKDGITVLDPATERFRTLEVPDYMRTHIRAIAEDSKGGLWIGTQDDLVRFVNGSFSQVKIPVAPELSVRSLLCEKDDTLWIGSRDDGLIRVREGKVDRFDAGRGLNHNRIYQMLLVENDLWLAGNKGIERVSKSELDSVANHSQQRLATQIFTKREGLRTAECGGDWTSSASVDAKGVLWFGTRAGLVQIDPHRSGRASLPPNVLITSVAVDDDRFKVAEFKEVKPGGRRLEIDFTALSLRNPANVFFQYKMENVDKRWVEAGRSREAVYYNLRPGSYRFQVKACNDEGIWNETGATLAFAVAPQIYQTVWFRGLAGGGCFTLFAMAYRWRVRSMRRHNRELELMLEERTREIQEEVAQKNDAEARLRVLNEELEARVKARTLELRNAYENLQVELHERLEVEQALARSEARLRRIVDSGMVGILFWHKNGSITDANGTFLKMIGYSREELEQGLISWERLTPPEYLPSDADALQEIDRTGVCAPFEKEYIRKDGSRFPILIGGASLSNDGDKGVCFVLDISQRKMTEEEVRRLNLSLEARVQDRTLELARANEQLAAEVQERKRVAVALASFSHLGQKLHSARTEHEAASIVAETARSLIPHDHCSIELYDADGRLIPVLDLAEKDAASEQNGPSCSISVSIRNGSRVVGILGLKSSNVEGFNYADANTLQALGDYCGGALERIHAEEARREIERRFSTFMTNAPVLAWMKDSQFKYAFTNEMFQRFTGLSADEVVGKTDYDLWPDHVAFHMRTHDSETVATQSKRETHEELRRSDGEMRTLLTLRFLFTTGTGEQFVAGMAIDVTDQKRAEDALHRLPQSILEAQEAERRRVARELHDGVNQAIASIKFRIQTAEQQILRSDPRWQETCGRTKDMLDSVLQQVRRLSRNLRPGELDDLGLVPAARAACQEFELRTGISVKFTHSEFQERLPAAIELSLYRIIQEALTNVEKHSAATNVTIDLVEEESYVMLEIVDNGCGFETGASPDRPTGLGLLHMRERVSLVGGVISLTSMPGHGVRINIQAPIRREKEAVDERP